MEQKGKACRSIIAAGKPFLCFFIRREKVRSFFVVYHDIIQNEVECQS